MTSLIGFTVLPSTSPRVRRARSIGYIGGTPLPYTPAAPARALIKIRVDVVNNQSQPSAEAILLDHSLGEADGQPRNCAGVAHFYGAVVLFSEVWHAPRVNPDALRIGGVMFIFDEENTAKTSS